MTAFFFFLNQVLISILKRKAALVQLGKPRIQYEVLVRISLDTVEGQHTFSKKWGKNIIVSRSKSVDCCETSDAHISWPYPICEELAVVASWCTQSQQSDLQSLVMATCADQKRIDSLSSFSKQSVDTIPPEQETEIEVTQ